VASPGFWNETLKKFESLRPHKIRLVWTSALARDPRGKLEESHYLGPSCPDVNILSSYRAFALEASKALGHENEEAWYDELRRRGLVSSTEAGSGRRGSRPDAEESYDYLDEYERVCIDDLVEASIALCHVYAAESLDIVSLYEPTKASSQDAHGPQERRTARRPVRRNALYEKIDAGVLEIEASQPKSHAEIFKALDDRHVPVPHAEPFESSGGWTKGFRSNPARAHQWLSKCRAKLELPLLPQGPKRPQRQLQ